MSRALNLDSKIIAVIGLGYVGLPLAVEFGKIRRVIGFDIKPMRIEELKSGQDGTLECSPAELKSAKKLTYTSDSDDLQKAEIFIVTVPTPIDRSNRPDMEPLLKASTTVGAVLKRGDIVVYESTVYPGATEEVCIPVLERVSGLKLNIDFFCGYSPERINPGDKDHRLPNIRKVTSGSTPDAAIAIDNLYSSIVTAGTHLAPSIKVAEAAKIIENTQRDLNIALMNELSLICKRLEIDTLEVLDAASTKWNFLKFYPGLVGGHCIGVDPYYLTHKAQELGYHPEVILAGRKINDQMGRYVADETIRIMLKRGITVFQSNILVLGLTFKENCPDVRNTKVADIISTLKEYQANVDVYDPWVSQEESLIEHGIECLSSIPQDARYDALIIAVAHRDFVELVLRNKESYLKSKSVTFDVRGILPKSWADARL